MSYSLEYQVLKLHFQREHLTPVLLSAQSGYHIKSH